MADLFDVIADPTRRELLRALLERSEAEGSGEVSVGELVTQLSLSQPTVSKHLKTLRDFSLVTVREQGQHRYYKLDATKLEPVAEWLGAFMKPAVEAEQALQPKAVLVAEAAAPVRLPAPVRILAVRLGAQAGAVRGRIRRRS
jgi:DNA-binding transcriptional ArsR family regulator